MKIVVDHKDVKKMIECKRGSEDRYRAYCNLIPIVNEAEQRCGVIEDILESISTGEMTPQEGLSRITKLFMVGE